MAEGIVHTLELVEVRQEGADLATRLAGGSLHFALRDLKETESVVQPRERIAYSACLQLGEDRIVRSP